MRRFALIGEKLGHSASVPIHRAIWRETGIEADYRLVEIPRDDFIARVQQLMRETDGFNITIPYKVDIMPLLSHVDSAAAAMGAVNTVVCGEHPHGHNTDAHGLAAMLRHYGMDPAGQPVWILGTGGASKAALVNCEDAGSAISGDKVGEVVNASSSANSNLALVNTVVTGSEDGYEAVKVVNSATVVPSVDGCVLTGFDKSDYALGANDWIRTVLSSALEIDPRGVEMDNGRVFRRVKGPDNRIGCRVWFASDGYYYVYDKNANSAKPWRRIADKTYYAAAISGLSTDDAMLADATCALRHKRNVEIGPVNPDKNGLMLILK